MIFGMEMISIPSRVEPAIIEYPKIALGDGGDFGLKVVGERSRV